MHYSKIILFLFFFTLVGCGKSPLLNKVSKDINEVTGGILLSEQLPNIKKTFSFSWLIAPSLDDLSSFELKLDHPLSVTQRLNVYLWMPEMGHGSSPVDVKQLNSTDYVFSELAFIMPGLWVLHIEVLEANKVIDKWQKSITL